ncbi:MAG: hypothetical protein H0T53_00170 [Herpetosiphonaceae bacterium]|nr:hypothetical protein [Herpetosiphonaceae bacterium]
MIRFYRMMMVFTVIINMILMLNSRLVNAANVSITSSQTASSPIHLNLALTQGEKNTATLTVAVSTTVALDENIARFELDLPPEVIIVASTMPTQDGVFKDEVKRYVLRVQLASDSRISVKVFASGNWNGLQFGAAASLNLGIKHGNVARLVRPSVKNNQLQPIDLSVLTPWQTRYIKPNATSPNKPSSATSGTRFFTGSVVFPDHAVIIDPTSPDPNNPTFNVEGIGVSTP